jgi:hypothetical protein
LRTAGTTSPRGGGRDEVRADRLDVVARDCELVRRGK